MRKLQGFLLLILLTSSAIADVQNGEIVPSSIIRADDLNTMLFDINSSLENKSLDPKSFEQFIQGEPVSKQKILDNILLVHEANPSPNLGNQILSSELNNIFNGIKNFINSMDLTSILWNVGYNSTMFQMPAGDYPVEPTDVSQILEISSNGLGTISPTGGGAGINLSLNPSDPAPYNVSLIPVQMEMSSNSSNRFLFSNMAEGVNLNLTVSEFQEKLSNNKIVHDGKIIPLKSYKIDQVASLTETSDLISFMKVIGNHLYFVGNSPDGNGKLYRMDENENIVRITNISPGLTDSFGEFILFNNEVYFTATAQKRLYKIVGDTAVQLTYLTGTQDSVNNLTVFNGNLYFHARNDFFQKMMRIDSNGELHQAWQFSSGSDAPSNMVVIGNDMFFTSMDSNGYHKVFKLGTNNVVSRISNIKTSASDSPAMLRNAGGALFFVANTGTQFSPQHKVFMVENEGTFAGAMVRLSNINNGGSDIIDPTSVNNLTYLDSLDGSFYFSAGINGANKLYRVKRSGTSFSLEKISNTAGTGFNDNITEVIRYGDKIYFIGSPFSEYGSSNKLFALNSSNQVSQVTNFSGADIIPDGISELTIFKDELFFRGRNSSGYTKLFKFNPQDGIRQVSNFRHNNNDFNAKSHFTEFNGRLYFSGGSSPYKLMRLTIE